MILRILPVRQRTPQECVGVFFLCVIDGVVHHDTPVDKLLAAGLDSLAADANTVDTLATFATSATMKASLVCFATVVTDEAASRG